MQYSSFLLLVDRWAPLYIPKKAGRIAGKPIALQVQLGKWNGMENSNQLAPRIFHAKEPIPFH